jgi:predicted DNA-binding transcriptional regulator AlpA
MNKINNVAAKTAAMGCARSNFEAVSSQPGKTLPSVGMSRWGQIAPFMPFSREKFRQLVKAGKAPPPHRLSPRCTCYANSDVLNFLADPVNYRAGAALAGVK